MSVRELVSCEVRLAGKAARAVGGCCVGVPLLIVCCSQCAPRLASPRLASPPSCYSAAEASSSSLTLVASAVTHLPHSRTCPSSRCCLLRKVIWQNAESLWQVHPTPRLYSPGGSIGLRFGCNLQLHVLAGGSGSTSRSPFPLGAQGPHLTQCDKSTCQMASQSVSRVLECDRRQTDRPRRNL